MQFKSRSFADFQKGREEGTLKYNMVRFSSSQILIVKVATCQ